MIYKLEDMNIKGLKLNKKMIHLLNESIDTINSFNLHGLECFNSFNWKGFSKEEFKCLLNLFVLLDNNGYFKNFCNDHTFIFNYSTDITEIDIATIGEINSNPVLIDIESKNGTDNELKKKMMDQLIKRKNDHLPQLIKDKCFLTFGFVNNEFVYGYYRDISGIIHDVSDETAVLNLLIEFYGYKNVEDFLMQTSNIASIAKICSDIESGTYKFYEDTNKHYSWLVNKIGKEDACIVYGHAGTGKSVLALKLFFEN